MEGGVVKIAVIGDDNVGKTSLIIASATESFPERPPPLLPPTRLPPETVPEQLQIIVRFQLTPAFTAVGTAEAKHCHAGDRHLLTA